MMKNILKEEGFVDDQILLKGLLEHLPRALQDLELKYHALLKSIVVQVLHNEAEADDVLQEVLLQVWERAATYSAKKGRLINWLCALAKRRAIDHVRRGAAYGRVTDRYKTACDATRSESEKMNPVAKKAEEDDLKNLLEKHLTVLPDFQQRVIRLAYFENKSQREISSLTHTPLGTVKTRLELGIKKMALSLGNLRYEFL